jgi:hypothetical protein
MKKTYILMALCFCFLNLKAQDANKIYYKNAFGVNVTSLLGEVISVGDNNNNDKFNLLYTRYGKKINFRIGANAFYKKQSELLFNSGLTELIDKAYKIRMGLDWRKELSSKFDFTYGFDALYLYNSSNSVTQTGFILNNTTNSYGIGPVMRFEYKLSKRISLMTESTMYFILGNNIKELSQNGAVISKENTKSGDLNTTIPSVLYLHVHF